MNIKNEDILDIDGVRSTPSLSSSVNLKPVYVGASFGASIQLVVSGTPAGNFKLQVSNDAGSINSQSEAAQYAAVSNWTDVGSSLTISSAGAYLLSITDCHNVWIRIVWTATGAGTTPVLTSARAVAKGV